MSSSTSKSCEPATFHGSAVVHDLIGQVLLLKECWSDYVELFGTTEKRVNLLNSTAPGFFGRLQNTQWDMILLRITRLSDRATTRSRDKNLTLWSLIDETSCAELRAVLIEQLQELDRLARLCRTHRNKRIAHRDLNWTRNRQAIFDAGLSRADVSGIINQIDQIIVAIGSHLAKSDILIAEDGPGNDAYALVVAIHDGLRFEEAVKEKIRTGKAMIDDLRPPDV